MKLLSWCGLVAGCVLSAACPAADPGGTDGGSKRDAGVDGGAGGNPAWLLSDLDSTPSEKTYLAMAHRSSDDAVGVAYFVSLTVDGGTTQSGTYALRYLEWKNGAVTAPQTVQQMQRVFGTSLAFQSNGSPAVAYLGGGADMTAFWLQSDVALSRRTGASTWTEEIVATHGDEVNCGSAVSDRGFLVGLFPALGFVGDTTFLAWRDGHDGQFPIQDWGGSDLEIAEGQGAVWTKKCLIAGGDNKGGWGGHNQMIVANGQPVIISSQGLDNAEATGKNVIFQRRAADGTWSPARSVMTVAAAEATIAFDATEGFGIAAADRATNQLNYISSLDGSTWTVPDPVVGNGSGGWYPSLAFDPVHHEPAIAYYVCALRSGVPEGACPPAEDEVRVTQRIEGNWQDVLVDDRGGVLLKLGYLNSGKRFVVYRAPNHGALRMAVEK